MIEMLEVLYKLKKRKKQVYFATLTNENGR